MNGDFGQDVERNRIHIEVTPGSTIKLTDNGPPTKLEAFGGPIESKSSTSTRLAKTPM